MPSSPETRESLILRLPTHSDAMAWREFITIYEPLLFRFARRRGLQDADAREIAQNVFLAVANAVDRWAPDSDRGSFRAWLFCIARNQLINYIAKHHRIRASGRTEEWNVLRETTSPTDPKEEIAKDYKSEMFRLAASQVREAVQEKTWTAFWNTAVLGKSPSVVSEEIGITVGAVYIAKCRVTSQIREIIQGWEANDAL